MLALGEESDDTLAPVSAVDTPADMLTKPLSKKDYERLLAKVGFTYAKNEDRKAIGGKRDGTSGVKDIAVELGQTSVLRAEGSDGVAARSVTSSGQTVEGPRG